MVAVCAPIKMMTSSRNTLCSPPRAKIPAGNRFLISKVLSVASGSVDQASRTGPAGIIAVEKPVTTRLAPCDRLSEQQRVCLRLVYAHLTSKAIARELGVSHHTIDQRLKNAMRILGAGSRVEAAQILAEYEHGPGHQPLVYQAPDVEDAPFRGAQLPPLNNRGNDLGTAGYTLREHRASFDSFTPAWNGVSAPPPQDRGHENDLNAVRRLAVIAAIAIGSALSFGAVIAGLEALSRIV